MKKGIAIIICLVLLNIAMMGCIEDTPQTNTTNGNNNGITNGNNNTYNETFNGSMVLKPSEIRANFEKYNGTNVTVRAIFFWGARTIIDKQEFKNTPMTTDETFGILLLACRFLVEPTPEEWEKIKEHQTTDDEFYMEGYIERGPYGEEQAGQLVITYYVPVDEVEQ